MHHIYELYIFFPLKSNVYTTAQIMYCITFCAGNDGHGNKFWNKIANYFVMLRTNTYSSK